MESEQLQLIVRNTVHFVTDSEELHYSALNIQIYDAHANKIRFK